MPRRGEYATIPTAPIQDENPVPRIGVRRANSAADKSVPQRTSVIDPSQYACPVLVGELADEWVSWATAANPDASSFGDARRAIREFAAFAQQHAEDPAALTLAADDPQVTALLREWCRHLPSGFPAGSTRPYTTVRMLRQLIRRRAERPGVVTGRPVLDWLAVPSGVPAGRTRELDEFTRKEKAALVRAAWAGVRRAEQRHAAGRAMLARAAGDPARHGWQDPANLLWALARHREETLRIRTLLPKVADWPADLVALAGKRTAPGRPGINPYRDLLTALAGYVYPLNADLQAFRVLLMAATGHAPEEITGLTEADMEFGETYVALTLTKTRAHLIRQRRFPDRPSAVFPDFGPLNTAEITRRLLVLTQRARADLGYDAAPLFVQVHIDQQLRLELWCNRLNIPPQTFSTWAQDQGVELSAPRNVRRLRKSGKVEKAIAARGVVSDIADDHSKSTYLGHYAHGTTLHVLSGQVITSAQQEWLTKAIGPVMLDQQALDTLESESAREALGVTPDTAAQIREGALDMGLGSCRDPFDSPYSKPGDLCAVAPLHCLECGNALILPSNLPQLLMFDDFVERLRQRMDPTLFHSLWGQQRANLRAALAEHGDADIATARRQIETQDLRLHLPLNAHTEFDR